MLGGSDAFFNVQNDRVWRKDGSTIVHVDYIYSECGVGRFRWSSLIACFNEEPFLLDVFVVKSFA